MIVDVGEHQFVDAGSGEIAKVGCMSRPGSAVAENRHCRMALHERAERRTGWLVPAIACLSEHAPDAAGVLRHRRVQGGDLVDDPNRHWAKRRRQPLAEHAIAYEHDHHGGAHPRRLPLV
jgi:hypothetical protein